MTLPDHPIFHYTSTAAFLAILERGELWLTDIRYQNDAYELDHARHMLNVVAHRLPRTPVFDELPHEARTAVSRLTQAASFQWDGHICTFSGSEHRNLLSQWRAYCPSNGLSLGFGPQAIADLAAEAGFRLAKCTYDESQHREALLPLVQRWHNALARRLVTDPDLKADDPFHEGYLEEFLVQAPFMKHPSFHEEGEWRLAGRLGNDDVKFRSHAAGRILPFFPLSIRQPDGTVPLEWIVVGPGPQRDLIVRGVRHALRTHGLSHVRVDTPAIGLR